MTVGDAIRNASIGDTHRQWTNDDNNNWKYNSCRGASQCHDARQGVALSRPRRESVKPRFTARLCRRCGPPRWRLTLRGQRVPITKVVPLFRYPFCRNGEDWPAGIVNAPLPIRPTVKRGVSWLGIMEVEVLRDSSTNDDAASPWIFQA